MQRELKNSNKLQLETPKHSFTRKGTLKKLYLIRKLQSNVFENPGSIIMQFENSDQIYLTFLRILEASLSAVLKHQIYLRILDVSLSTFVRILRNGWLLSCPLIIEKLINLDTESKNMHTYRPNWVWKHTTDSNCNSSARNVAVLCGIFDGGAYRFDKWEGRIDAEKEQREKEEEVEEVWGWEFWESLLQKIKTRSVPYW